MALSVRVAVSCSISVSADGTQLNFIDNTNQYNATTAPLGYGVSGGITTSNITSSTLVLTWGSLKESIIYTFTVANNVVTAATITDVGGTVINILSQLTSTTFPFTSANPFNLVKSWTGVTNVPTFTDDVYTLDYTITGVGSGQAFSYTCSSAVLRTFDTCCCVSKLGLNIDPTCSCSSDSLMKYLQADSYLTIAGYALDTGKTDDAVTLLNKAKSFCDGNGCGC